LSILIEDNEEAGKPDTPGTRPDAIMEKFNGIRGAAYRIYGRVPEIFRTALISAAAGLLLWGVMDYMHTTGIVTVVHDTIVNSLNKEAINGRFSFNDYVRSFNEGIRLITAQKIFIDYIDEMYRVGRIGQSRPDRSAVVTYTDFPPWLPVASLPRQYTQMCYAVLLDAHMKAVEVYSSSGCGKGLPDALLNPSVYMVHMSRGQSYLTTIEDVKLPASAGLDYIATGVAYVISSETVYDAAGGERATLMTASPVDSGFLELSQRAHESEFIVALLEGKDSRVMASSRANLVPPGRSLDELRKDYIVSVKEFLDYGYSDLIFNYATMISKKDAMTFTSSVLFVDKKDLAIYSLAMSLLIFAALTYKRSMRGMKSSLQTLVSSKEFVESILFSLNDGIIVVACNGDIMMLNDTASVLLEYEGKELAGRPLGVVLPDMPSDESGAAPDGTNRPIDASIDRYEGTCISKSGLVIPVMISRTSMVDKYSVIRGTVVVIQDITERKKAEETMRQDYILQHAINLVLQLSLRPMSMDIFLSECLDLIVSVNKLPTEERSTIHIVEEQPEVLVMRARRGTSEDFPNECFFIPFGKCMCGRAAQRREIIFEDHVSENHDIQCRDTKPHGHYCTPIISGDKVLGVINLYVKAGHVKTESEMRFLSSIASVLAGVMERKHAESDLQKAKERLEHKAAELEKVNTDLKEATAHLVQSEKLSALGELTAGVAHELNQPLNGIKIICQSVIRDVAKGRHDEKELVGDLAQIVEQVDKMAGIIDHMRVFTRRSEGMLTEALDINNVVELPFKLLGQQLRNNNIQVVKELAEGLPQVKGDPIRLEQVFMNLITNAKNAMDGNGDRHRRLVIRTRMWEGAASQRNGARARVCVEFEDNGTGIPPEIIDKIFQPFFTTKEPGKGTGLGLSLSNTIVQEHGGSILVESEPGRGSLFRVLLPALPINTPVNVF
jgi:PAS domain S-box-containing protein